VWRLVLSDTKGDASEVAARKSALSKYERFLSSNYVDINRNIKWCPAPHCGWAVHAVGAVKEVTCIHCRYSFCFKCGQPAHAPLSCDGLAAWNEKCSNESETANWFVANTKKCPKCSTHIEKNQGCNHMHCGMCKNDFCWLCLGPWSEHGATTGGFYQCNKYDPNASKKKEDNVSAAKRELDRYIHYYTRYQAHDHALKFASKQREQAEVRMTDLQKKGGKGWIDVQFIMEAVEQLIECRRVLKYTYAYAFQLPDGPRKTLFEHNQMMLESNTEKLSELSEKDVEAIDRASLINYTRVTGTFLRSLLDNDDDSGAASV
jgi:ariadne-1